MTAPIDFLIYHHKSANWVDYLLEYSSLSAMEAQGMVGTSVHNLPDNSTRAFADLPEALRRLLFFGKPDLVICIDDGIKPIRPIFALDVTEHVAAADHWMQRFPNLVGCAQEGVPGVFITPGDMPKRAKFKSAKQPMFYFAFDRVIEIHQTPLFIAEWTSSDKTTLDGDSRYHHLPPHDGAEMVKVLNFFNLVLDFAIRGQDFGRLMQDRLIVNLRHDLRNVGYARLPEIRKFQRLATAMPNNRPLSLAELDSYLIQLGISRPAALPDRIKKRDRYLIYTPRVGHESKVARRDEMLKRIKLKGGDPYGPQPLVFDYLFCRLGPTPLERDVSVVVDLSFFGFADFASYIQATWNKSPLKHGSLAAVSPQMAVYALHLSEPLIQVIKNYIRWQVFAADMILFDDGVLVL